MFDAARKASYKSDFNVRVGCVVAAGGKVLAEGFSQQKTDPIQKRFNKYRHFGNVNDIKDKVHAECMAIKKIRFAQLDPSKISIYIYREHANHTPAMARPCAACEQYIRETGIRNVYYTGEGSMVYENFI